jgi:uncharacterized membrane protein YuzA (DUF378 family)
MLLGLSFVAQTVVLAWEYQSASWFDFLTHDSHLFLFFPTFGLVALAAFYVPSCVFVDMYWRHVRFGPARFIAGFLVVAGLAYFIAHGIAQSRFNAIWQISPDVLRADRGEPAGCSLARPCDRIPLLEAVNNVSTVSRSRLGLRDFVRTCEPDPLLEITQAGEKKRFCFASTPLTSFDKSRPQQLRTDSECCRSQSRFSQAIGDFYAKPEQRSLTGRVHVWLLPLKVFFLLVLLAISILLALRYEGVARHYERYLGRLERGVLIGTIAMIFFPLMSQAFVQTADALYGTTQSEGFKPMVPMMSFAFGAWGLLILLFFYRRRDREVELLAKMGGVIGSAIAVLKYDLIVAIFVRLFGSGAGPVQVAVVALVAVICFAVLMKPRFSAVQKPQE